MKKVTFEPAYFVDEVREQFYIPGMVKRSWAAQIKLLTVITDICDRHNIKWYATYGTLLGAVRHGGFIPWDDDLDIAMFREDYDRFNRIIKDELPDNYCVLNMYTELEYCDFLTRITNGLSLNISNEYLMGNFGFPYVTGIDIFPMDYIFEDEAKEEKRLTKCQYVWKKIETIDSNSQSQNEIAYEIKNVTGYTLDRSIPVKPALHLVLDRLFTECSREEAIEAVVMPVWIKYGTQKRPLNLYATGIDVPFENTTVKAPIGYGEVLKIEYKFWEKSNKAGGAHNYPFFHEQEQTLISEKAIAPYHYLFNANHLDNKRCEQLIKSDSIYEIISTMDKATSLIGSVASGGDIEATIQLLNNCQQLAINAGTLIEENYSAPEDTVSLLEAYCEQIYELSLDINSDSLSDEHLTEAGLICNSVLDTYRTLRNSCGATIFMPVLYTDWKYMEPYYNEAVMNNAGKVFVMPLPYADRLHDGSAEEFVTDIKMFPEDLPLISFDEINLDSEIISEIVIQNPWDEFGSGRVVHPAFFSSVIKNKTDKLTYIPAFNLPNIPEKEEKSITNAERYVVSPGVIHSDLIILGKDSEKSLYINWLIKATGLNDYEFWNKKIRVFVPENDELTIDGNIDKKEKKLLFYISISDMYLHGKQAVSKIRHSFELLRKNESISMQWVMDDNMFEIIEKNVPDIYKEFNQIVRDFTDNGYGCILKCSEVQKAVEEADAFYGSGGYALNMCVNKGIPVMICNLEI